MYNFAQALLTLREGPNPHMDNQEDPNGNLYRILTVETPYTVEAADHMRRRALIGEHRIRRACAQVALLQRLTADAATSAQMVFLEMEADLQTERHELDTEWCTSALKAYEAGEQTGRANGYSEALTDSQIVLQQPPTITH